jgi:hypothetical protein
MQVIEEYDNGVDFERPLIFYRAKSRAQGIDIFREQAAAAFQQGNGKKRLCHRLILLYSELG